MTDFLNEVIKHELEQSQSWINKKATKKTADYLDEKSIVLPHGEGTIRNLDKSQGRETVDSISWCLYETQSSVTLHLVTNVSHIFALVHLWGFGESQCWILIYF